MARPKIIDITVNIELPSGKVQTISVKPDSTAIFFHEDTVKTMLGNFYKNNPGHKLHYSDSLRSFGKKITDSVFPASPKAVATATHPSIDLNEQVISDIWNAEDEFGLSVPLISKTPPCMIG